MLVKFSTFIETIDTLNIEETSRLVNCR